MSNPPVVRAIDLGFGGTKFTHSDVNADGTIRCTAFPSLVAEPSQGTVGAEILGGGNRKTLIVNVKGASYEVGPDVEQLISTRDGRTLHRGYSETDEYAALVYGALAMMDLPVIDMLVMGLPVQAEKARYEALKKRFVGEHQINAYRKVEVKNVHAIAQPMGALVNYAFNNKLLNKMSDRTTLLIDVGFFTVDYVVATGTRLHDGRSGGHEAGVSEYLKRMQAALKSKIGEEIGLNRLDVAVRKGGEPSVRIFGKEHSLEDYRATADTAINDGMNTLLSRVGKSDDIDEVFVCGGGAHLYMKAVKARFPRHTVTMLEDPVFSNVRGFAVVGQMLAMKQASLKAA